jgi:hypothetical protein
MIAAAAVTFGLREVSFAGSDAVVYAKRSLITGAVATVAWLVVTFLTPAESDATLTSFYRRVHPTVYGWKRVAKLVPELPEVRDVAGNAFSWLMGVLLVYGCLFGIGKLIFGDWLSGFLLLAMAAVSGYLIFWDLSRRGWQTFSGGDVKAAPEIASAR